MNVEEAIEYCYKHRNQFIVDSGDVNDGVRQFDCLISLLEDNFISPDDLPKYGMEY